jgi:hypothetical protein
MQLIKQDLNGGHTVMESEGYDVFAEKEQNPRNEKG